MTPSRGYCSCFRCAIDSSKWQDFLTCLTGITGTAAAALVSHDVATNASALLAFGGVQADPDVQQRYNECYVAIDPFRAPFLKRLPPTIVDGDELVDGEAFQRGASYNELIAPVGLQHALMLPAIKRDRIDLVTLWRTRRLGPMDARARNLLASLLPHLQLALQTDAALKKADKEAFLAQSLSHVGGTCFLLNQVHAIVAMRQTAEALLRSGDGLCTRGSVLQASSPAMQRRLSSTSNACIAHLPSNGALRLKRPSGKRDVYLLVSPVRLPGASLIKPSLILVKVHDATAPVCLHPDDLRARFGLTPAESEVANLLLAWRSLVDISAVRGVSVATVRLQVKAIMAKTETGRQSELVQMPTQFAPLR